MRIEISTIKKCKQTEKQINCTRQLFRIFTLSQSNLLFFHYSFIFRIYFIWGLLVVFSILCYTFFVLFLFYLFFVFFVGRGVGIYWLTDQDIICFCVCVCETLTFVIVWVFLYVFYPGFLLLFMLFLPQPSICWRARHLSIHVWVWLYHCMHFTWVLASTL